MKRIFAAVITILMMAALLISTFAKASTVSDSAAASSMPASGAAGTPPSGGQPPAMPDGGNGQPPAMPGGGMGGVQESDIVLAGVLSADGSQADDAGAVSYDGTTDGETIASAASGENVVLSQNNAQMTVSNVTLAKTGDDTNSEETDFYAVNAVVAAKSGSKIMLNNVNIQSDAQGANNVFASGQGTDAAGNIVYSTIYAKGLTILSSKDNSRGLDATYGGVIVAGDVSITTQGAHCAGIATDRGGGFISVKDATISTAGGGSPILYSTGVLEAENLTGTATGAQMVGMEGLNTVRLLNSNLSSTSNAQDDVNNGVIIYQSTSGDSSAGTAVFQAVDSTLSTTITGPGGDQVDSAMFYVTNTQAEILLSGTALNFDTKANKLLVVRGNSHNNWGTPGQNGGQVKFSAIGQSLAGDISCDGISTVDMYLTLGSTFTGAIVKSTEYEGEGGVTFSLQSGTSWTVTGTSTLNALYAAEGSIIQDANGKTVSIVGLDGTTYVAGDSSYTVTVGTYVKEDHTASAGMITELSIDRTGFDETFI